MEGYVDYLNTEYARNKDIECYHIDETHGRQNKQTGELVQRKKRNGGRVMDDTEERNINEDDWRQDR